MKKKRAFSGIQPSGNLHLGNYIGAIKQWVALQDQYECIFSIVDLHAITVSQDPQILKRRVKELTALYLACGIDPQQSALFVQSHNPDHPSLAWILDCVASMGQLGRMTQYKTKAKENRGRVSVGLFNYPVLMAADILLYETEIVPVGEDQVQHVELTRDLAERFNSRFGPVLKLPQAKVLERGARLMSLRNPAKKMSKSDEDKMGRVDLLDPPDEVRKKIKTAMTDSGKEIVFRQDKPGISNLLIIYSQLGGKSIAQLEKEYAHRSYREFKEDLAEVVIEFLKPIQKKYRRIISEKGYLETVLRQGLVKVKPISEKTLEKVYRAMGLR